MSARETAELLLLLGRLVQAEGYHGDLSPAQWMALRLLRPRQTRFPAPRPDIRRNFKRRPVAPHTQTIKALETGWVLRSDSDRRRTGS